MTGPYDIYRGEGVRYEGDRSSPFSTAVLTGKFKIEHIDNNSRPDTFYFIGRDYGGLSGDINIVEKRLNVLVRHYGYPTELVLLD